MNARIVVFLAAVSLLASGCGSSEPGGDPPDYEKALTGAPAPLAALYEQDSELLGGGVEAYERRLAALRGYPVVVNLWASWCGPCRFEFPWFQEATARYGKRVAFLGIDKEDSDDAAETFLREEPLPYPSYSDPDEEIAESIDGDATRGLPTTAFYDRSGELAFLKLGPYDDEDELRADIERYALGLVGAGVYALTAESDSSAADWAGPGLITLGLLCLVTSYVVGRKVLAAHRDEPVRTGPEELVGARAEVRTPLDPEGQVWIEGALWRARLGGGDAAAPSGDGGAPRPGDRVVVEAVEGLTLVVRPETASVPTEEGAG